MTPEEYAAWWDAQFPCSCGHPPERHFIAPKDGQCRACANCHGEGGAFQNYAIALFGAGVGPFDDLQPKEVKT